MTNTMTLQQTKPLNPEVVGKKRTVLMVQTPQQEGNSSKNIVLRLLDPATKQGSIKLGKNGKVVIGTNKARIEQQKPAQNLNFVQQPRHIIMANQQKSQVNTKGKMTSLLKDRSNSHPYQTPFYCNHEDCSENFIKNLYRSRQIKLQTTSSHPVKNRKSLGQIVTT